MQALTKNQIVSSAARSIKSSVARVRTPLGLTIAITLLVVALGLPAREYLAINTRSYVYPLMGTRISSDFGNRVHPVKQVVRHHHGMDLAAPYGAPIRAIAGGTVIFSDPYAGYGRLVVVQHERGLTSHYGHCETLKAKPGQHIKAGQVIATVGSSGISTGPHLHFEIRLNGEPQNPERYIPGLALPGEG